MLLQVHLKCLGRKGKQKINTWLIHEGVELIMNNIWTRGVDVLILEEAMEAGIIIVVIGIGIFLDKSYWCWYRGEISGWSSQLLEQMQGEERLREL